MEIFVWGSQFITGLDLVDEQHQSLITMLNTFGQALSEHTVSEDFLMESFHKLAEYAQCHFKTEEELMAKMQVDLRHISSHLAEHRDFVSDVTNLIETIDVRNQEDCRSLFEYLTHWLVYHILGSDKNMARQVAAIRQGIKPATAYQEEEKEASSSTEPLLIALNTLFTLVSRRNKALMELNRTLEERVIERTRELSEANKALEIISITDHLTQLPNRRFAMNQLEKLLKESRLRNQPLSCLMVDVDNFKGVNDTWGHGVGNIVLKKLAKELQCAVRTDDIVCRLGGDEFFIICPNTSLEGALYVGEHTKLKVNALKIKTGEGFWRGSVSIGVACSHDDLENMDALIKVADDSVYLAKKDGKNCVRSTQQLT